MRAHRVILAASLCAMLGFSLSRLLAAPSSSFDYYVLSLTWAPEFCSQPAQAAANPLECASGKDINFVVHGLWPEATTGRGPESCGPARSVPKPIVNSLLRYMPSASLIQHEWATHGTCSGLSVNDYFNHVLQARSAVQVPVQISSLGAADTETPQQIEQDFAGSNPTFPKGAFRTACRNGELTEVRVCFDKDIKPRACTTSVTDCGSRPLTIRPPR